MSGVKWGVFSTAVLVYVVEPPLLFGYLYGKSRYEKR